MADAHAERLAELQKEAVMRHNAMQPIRLEDLPSKGLFYPENTKIWIKAVTVGDVKRWTSMNEDDWSDINDKIQDIIQSCVVISFGPDSPYRADWKDLMDIDRMYLMFAIHDYSFEPGTNDIMVKLNEKDDTILHKENVEFLNLDEKLMKYYNADKRCFSFPVSNAEQFKETGGFMDLYMPTLGVENWLVDYVQECERRRDVYDKDFIRIAAILIPNWRGFNVQKYIELMDKTDTWGKYEWTLLSKVASILVKSSTTPILKYNDGGIEREVPVIFRDGFKSIFQVRLDIDL